MSFEEENIKKEIVFYDLQDEEQEIEENTEVEVDDCNSEDLSSLSITLESTMEQEKIQELPHRKSPLKYSRNEEQLSEEIKKGQIEDKGLQE
ncbi:UNVERIFIED_CONTAM: hypothetical protein RMT77_012162 [Armadillidium vulgare]